MCIVIDAPCVDLGQSIVDGTELRDVQAFMAQPAIERFCMPVLIGFSQANEVEIHSVDDATGDP